MNTEQKAKELVNEKYYQPLTIHLNLNNNSKEMWEYAKRCAIIAVEEIINLLDQGFGINVSIKKDFWQQVKRDIEAL